MNPNFEEFGEENSQFRALVETLEVRARKLGLYLDFAKIQNHPESGDLFLAADFVIGDVAFAPRVQDPEQDKKNDEFREITDNLRTQDPSVDPAWDDLRELRETLRKIQEDDD